MEIFHKKSKKELPKEPEHVKSESFKLAGELNAEKIFRDIRESKEANALASIEKKLEDKEELSGDDLIFLYGLKIKGFGYERDPKIKKILKKRNPEEDLPLIFSKDQIAQNPQEINEETKIYVGKLKPGIFDLIQKYHIEHIYTSFPEGRINIERNFEAGPLTLEEFKKRAEEYNRTVTDESLKIEVFDYVEYLMKQKEFASFKKEEQLDLIRLSVNDLFNDNQPHTTEEIYQKAQELGLELCPPEVGPLKRLQDKDQPMNDWYWIAMKPISDPAGVPRVFELVRREGGAWLDRHWARRDNEWYPHNQFVFCSRPAEAA